ncbi:MAG: VanZ family protein [Lachnospiraceae bacterium]|nr:VanZ family protein [Lachnospiraceae bacterium]
MSDFTVLCVNTFAAYIGVIPFLIILQLLFRKCRLPKRHQFGVYLYALGICLILMASDTPSLYQINFYPQFNFIPFYGFMDSLGHYIQSFLIYIPFGLLLPTLWKRFKHAGRTVLYGLLLSVIIEISQIFCLETSAVTDITDVIMNVLGTTAGYLLYLLISRMHFMRRMCLGTKDARKKVLSKWEIYIYFLAPWLVTFLLTPFISNALWNIIWNYALGMPI